MLARFTVSPSDIAFAKIKATSSDFLGNLGEAEVEFESGVSSPEYVRFSAASGAPSVVGKGTVTWEWKFFDVEESGSGEAGVSVGGERSSGPHTIYTLLGEPYEEPWETWGQERVWTEVLDYASAWADGEASEGGAADAITVHAYNDFGKDYNGYLTHASGTTLELSDLLADTEADCRDMSATVHAFLRALGGASTQVRRIWGRFTTKSIDPVGSPGWDVHEWNFHQVTHYSNVYDSCLRLDPASPRIPRNEDVNGAYRDDLYDSGTWEPGTPFEYNGVN